MYQSQCNNYSHDDVIGYYVSYWNLSCSNHVWQDGKRECRLKHVWDGWNVDQLVSQREGKEGGWERRKREGRGEGKGGREDKRSQGEKREGGVRGGLNRRD